MEAGLTPGAITAIADLLAPPDEDSDSDLDQVFSLIPQARAISKVTIYSKTMFHH